MSLDSKTIGLVTWDYAEGKGGLGRAMKMMIDALDQKSIILYTPQQGNLQCTKRIGGHVLFSFMLLFTLQKWIDKHHIDLLLLPTGPGGVFLFRKPKRCRIISISYHTYAQQARCVPGERWKNLLTAFEKKTLKNSSKVLVYSRDTEAALQKEYHIPKSSIRFLPQILNIDEWVPRESIHKTSGLCICVARLEKRKGVSVLLEAWKSVHRNNPEARLLIVGDGAEQKKIDDQIRSLDASVKRIPHLSIKDLVAHVQEAEVAVCPSYLEGFGLAAVEAMAAGTTLIASNVEGLKALVTDQKTGVLVPPGNPAELADAILSLLSSDQRRKVLAGNAQTFVTETFAVDRARRALSDALEL